MKFIELTVHTTTEASELVADAMWEHTSLGVAVSDVADVIALQRDSSVFWDYIDESVAARPKGALVKCFLEPERAEETASAVMREIFLRRELSGGAVDFGTLENGKREIEGDEWIEIWKNHFRPLHIGARIVVVPAWVEYTPAAHEVPVVLGSDMAFGTGEHETTAMCLELLQEIVKEGDVCIDVGCGSGILGIACAKLGAKRCYLSDLDPVAVESARRNCRINGVSHKTAVSRADLIGNDVRADVILANITAEILQTLAPSAAKCLSGNGTLILSGILGDRLAAVKAAYGAAGLRPVAERARGEWRALVLRR